MSDLEYRFIEPDEHGEEMIALYRKVLGAEITREQYAWKYEEIPLEKMRICSAWDRDSGGLVGALAAFRRHFIRGGEIVVAYHLADAMVDARYRGQGIYRKILEMMMDFIGGEGALFWLGYPNDTAAPIYRKYENSEELYLSRRFVFMNGCSNLAFNYLKLRNPFNKRVASAGGPPVRLYNRIRAYGRKSGLILKPVEAFDDRVERWSFETARDFQFFPLRDAEFLRWKAIDVPAVIKKDLFTFWITNDGSRIGYCVLYRDIKRNILKIIDILCENPGRNLGSCLDAILGFAISRRFDTVITSVTGDLAGRRLKGTGFIELKPVRSRVYFYDEETWRNARYDGSFWYQTPIDRDNLFY